MYVLSADGLFGPKYVIITPCINNKSPLVVTDGFFKNIYKNGKAVPLQA